MKFEKGDTLLLICENSIKTTYFEVIVLDGDYFYVRDDYEYGEYRDYLIRKRILLTEKEHLGRNGGNTASFRVRFRNDT